MNSFFPVSNSFCGPASFIVEVVDGPWLRVNPETGTVQSGGAAPIGLLASLPADPAPVRATVRVVGPSNTVEVAVEVIRP